MNITAAIANSLWLASSLPVSARFRRALHHPAEIQTQLLHDYLTRNSDTAFGRAYSFAEIKTYEEFARRVPLNDYDDLTPWIERTKRGEIRVLTDEPVTHLVPTSGSSGTRKLIPFTATLQREFNRAIGAWIADLYIHHPSVTLGTAYWSISPAIQIENVESSAVPVGFDDESVYLGGTRKRLVDAVMAVPSEMRLVSNMEQFRYLTLLCLLRRRDLSLISVWHPSFLSLLLDTLNDIDLVFSAGTKNFYTALRVLTMNDKEYTKFKQSIVINSPLNIYCVTVTVTPMFQFLTTEPVIPF
jgi:hypothetical protein